MTWFLEGLSLASLVGKDFRTVDSVGENEFFSNFPFDYKYAIQPGDIIRLFESSTRIPGKSQTIGGFRKKGSGEGKVIYLSPSQLFTVLSDSSARKPADLLSIFLTELLQAINHLELNNVRSFEQPDWVLRYLLPKERNTSGEVQQLKSSISKMTAALQTKENELSAGSWIFDLLTTDGARLEESVIKAIREMGLAVVSGPDKLADAIVTDGQLVLAVEIKGYKGAAKEGAVSQCNRWVADVSAAIDPEADVADPIVSKYREKLAELDASLSNPEKMKDFEVKGMVICNTFFEQDLSTRPDQVTRVHEHFPEAFLSRANGFKVSCLTTLQLIDLLKLSREKKADAVKKFSEFARTLGYVATNQDWRATFQLEK